MIDHVRPGILATKAVNQYRARDAFAYLGLRQLMKGSVARADEWARTVAVDQVIRRSVPSYFVSEHFKERDKSGRLNFRKIAVPGPVEIMAETVLLAECAKHEALATHSSVFTYRLSSPSDRSGIFSNYMVGLRARHRVIEAECIRRPDAVVKFIDIRRFYPSIRTSDLQFAWRKFSLVLGKRDRELGERLISDHQSFVVDDSRGLLTGPMYSHFLANLVMKDFDEWAASEVGIKYIRYVDDITLIGGALEVRNAQMRIAERLKALGLELHGEDSAKTVEVSAVDWLVGKSDFEHDFGDITWGRFVSDLKSFLTISPDKAEELSFALADDGGRLPIFDYSLAVREAKHAASFVERAKKAWFRFSVSGLTVQSIVKTASILKRKMESEVEPMLAELHGSDGFMRKRLVPKLRFRIGRLAYLSEESVLKSFSDAAAGIEELDLQKEAIGATVSGDISSVVSMGSNAVQAAIQPLKASGKAVFVKLHEPGEVEMQGLATAVLNGVDVDIANPQIEYSDMLKLSMGNDVRDLRKSSSGFIAEVAFLAGNDGSHLSILSQAFDEDELISLDAVERFQESAPREF